MSGSLAAELHLLQKLPPPRRPRLLTHREGVFDELLDHYTEAQETLWSGQGADDGADGGVRLMPLVWNDSYRKLEKILDFGHHLILFDRSSPGFRRDFLALQAWYLRCVRMPKVSEQKTVRRGGEVVELPRTVRMHVTRNADPFFVLAGLEWVAGHFPGEPFVPREILEVAA